MRKVRKGVFETNSSSTHNICISNKNNLTQTMLVENGVVEVSQSEFGWEEEVHSDPSTKASYLHTWLESYYKGYHPDSAELYKANLEEVIKKHTLADTVLFAPSSDPYGGYVDHADDFDGGNILENKNRIRQFLFDPESVIKTSNDNSGEMDIDPDPGFEGRVLYKGN